MSDLAQTDRLDLSIVAPELPIQAAIARLDTAGTGALLVCTPERMLLGLLTDGDIRRAILQSRSLDGPCIEIASRAPITVAAPISQIEALRLMNAQDINHLPVVDQAGHVEMFLLRKDLLAEEDMHVSAVIMAGGFGTRLRPLTESIPKPMLPIGNRPLLERTIKQLKSSGVREVNMTTHYLSDAIVEHFGDGSEFGVEINYCQETNPLGTAGGLRLVKNRKDTLLVMNGDILTGLPLHEFIAYHKHNRADMTVGLRKYEFKVPYGVVKSDGFRITSLQEKPLMEFFINAGTYLVSPAACEAIPEGRRFDMTDLIQALIDAGRTVVGFPIREYWLDIGRHEDYQQAQEDFRCGRI
jgi:dTDP-glucose pyrophosphorylase